MIPQDTIDRILSTVRIEEYIGKDIQLQKKGVNYIGCCPFHSEKTPSFVVSPSKGIFKCYGCGEGGNIFGWAQKRNNMTFPEAVEKLASEHNIEFKKRELTPQEREEAAIKESLRAANEEANKYFIAQLSQNPKAMEYAKSRWSEQGIQEMEIGYSPEGWTDMRDHLMQKQYSIKVLEQAGLINFSEARDDHYDFFRGRITIPIRDKNGLIIGFTARIIAINPNVGKFINTKETILYNKSKNLFGIYHAQKEAIKRDKLILVEGAPDVIRLQQIGVANSVAPLGTALTDEQIELMRRYTKNILLIPDTDAPGQKAAVKNGVKLMRAGFSVSIMMLQGGGKDADEVLRHRSDYDTHLEDGSTQDFMFWHAATSLKGCKESQQEKYKVIQEICEILAHIPSEGMRELYITELSNAFKPKKVWLTAMAEALGKIKNQELKKKSEEESNMYAEFGFRVENNSYFGATKNSRGVESKWSNFIMTPLAHVVGFGSKRLYTITNNKGQSHTIEMPQEDLVSLARFRVKTESMGNFLWEAKEDELHAVKRYLYENTLTCDEIGQLGWQKRHNFFAWSNGGVVDGEFIPTNDIGILKINNENFYLPAHSKIFQNEYSLFQFERNFSYSKANNISLYDLCERYIAVFGDNAKISLCFLFATIFRDIIFSNKASFPMLNIFGPMSTGKTAAAQVLTAFFTVDALEEKPLNLDISTIPAISAVVARVSNAIVLLDEYKNHLGATKIELLKGIWGGSGRNRINMDKDKKNEITNVDAGVILVGQEMATADPALFSRIIFLTYNRDKFTEEESRRFNDLKLICNRGLSHLTNQILKYRKQVELTYRADFKHTSTLLKTKLNGQNVNERVFSNWATIISILRSLQGYITTPLDYEEIIDIAVNGISSQDNRSKESSELSVFWDTFEALIKARIIIDGVHFKVKAITKPITVNEYKDKITLDRDKEYLMVHYNAVSNLIFKDLRNRGESSIPKDSLKHYLKYSPEFIGTKKGEKFKVLAHSSSTSTLDFENSAPAMTQQCMMFDYEMIEQHFGISVKQENYRELDDDDPFSTQNQSQSPGVEQQELEL